jgi:hypothetical protein
MITCAFELSCRYHEDAATEFWNAPLPFPFQATGIPAAQSGIHREEAYGFKVRGQFLE